MKKLNNKGITIIEVLVCFVLVVTISMSIFSTVSAYNDKRMLESYKSKVLNYKNILTKDMQDDFITIGLTTAKYTKQINTSTNTIEHRVDCNLANGTKRVLLVKQRFTKSITHPEGSTTYDDEFSIKYGDPDKELMDYELPDLGSTYVKTDALGKVITCKSETETGCREQKDLSINNVLIDVTDNNVLSIYIGFYHPELSKKYGVNVVAPMDFSSKLSDMSTGLDVPQPEVAKYTVQFVLGTGASGTVSPITVNVGETMRLPYATIENGIHKAGYSLKGWTSAGEGETSIEYAVGTTYKFNRNITLYAVWEPEKTSFVYTPGYIPSYKLPATGRYKIQVWGAAGGALSDSETEMGYGGYAEATIRANAGTVLYVNIGTAGIMTTSNDIEVNGGENGGGKAIQQNIEDAIVGSGGGATSISTYPGLTTNKLLNERNDIFSIVAAGGGGSYYKNNTIKGKGGCGGGLYGQSGQQDGVWSTIVNSSTIWNIRNRFPGCAMGANGIDCDSYATAEVPTNYAGSPFPLAGAGNGFCGGYVSGAEYTGAGGGSSYIISNDANVTVLSSKTYCYNCYESDRLEEKTSHETAMNMDNSQYLIDSYSGFYSHSSTLSSLSNSQLTGEILSSKDGFARIVFIGS